MPPFYSYPLQNPETNPVRKAQILLNQFFPPQTNTDLSDTQEFKYKQGLGTGSITMHEIRQSILIAISNKAPGKDGIPNCILKSIIDPILLCLHIIFNACLLTGYYPTHFCLSITVVL